MSFLIIEWKMQVVYLSSDTVKKLPPKIMKKVAIILQLLHFYFMTITTLITPCIRKTVFQLKKSINIFTTYNYFKQLQYVFVS